MAPTENDRENSVLVQLIESVKVISESPECRNVFKKMYGTLVRRIKLLCPLLDEIRDITEVIGEEDMKGLELLRFALDSTKELLMSVNQGSKLYQVLIFGHLLSVYFFFNPAFCWVSNKEK